jgi:hypothetical protein
MPLVAAAPAGCDSSPSVRRAVFVVRNGACDARRDLGQPGKGEARQTKTAPAELTTAQQQKWEDNYRLLWTGWADIIETTSAAIYDKQ